MKRTLGLLVSAVALLGMAFAQQTPANTTISNQASATYIDSAGQNQNTTSNQVLTVVQQVYSFTITPNSSAATEPLGAAGFAQSRTALPGARVYFPYTVSNTGNGPDTINLTSVAGTAGGTAPVRFVLPVGTIYRDNNCNGTVDSGESSISSVALTQNAGVGAATSSACVIIETTIPGTAANNEVGNINLSGVSAGNSSATDVDNWSRAIATTSAALDIIKNASPSGLVTPGSNITYNVSGQNRGGSAASGLAAVPSGLTGNGILISDVVPNGLSVTVAPTGSSGAGTVTMVYSTNGTTWSSTAPSFPWLGDGIRRVGMWITGSGAFFPQGASYTFSFIASVPSGASSGATYNNTATLQFNNGADVGPVSSNTTSNTVATTFGVRVGPTGAPTAAGNGAVGSADSQTATPNPFSGQTVIFNQTLRNTGNSSDSFTLALGTGATAPNLAPPSTWSCQFTATDGTPINTAVGPFAAGGDYNFQVRCSIPASYTTATAVSFNVIAASVASSTTTDPTANTVTAVTSGYGVDLATDGNTSRPETAGNDNPAGQSTNPATSVSFPLDVRNNGENTDTYELTATVPSGWSVQFINDLDGDGVVDSGEPVVNNTGLLAINTIRNIIAVVTVPAGTSPGSNAVTFTATSSTISSVLNSVSTTVTVNEVRAFIFDPNRSGTVSSPGTIVYTHNLRNNGNSSATVAIPAPSFLNPSRGWTYQYSTDGGTTWSSTVTGLTLAANASATLQVRVIVPAGEAIGTVETAQITATATYSGGTAAQTVDDTTTIVAGDLTLAKSGVSFVGSTATVRSATAATALPGDEIVYTVVATNNGTANLTNVKISDPLPSYTDFVSVSASTTIVGGTVVYSTDGTTWTTTAPTSLAAGLSIYVAVNTAGTAGGAGSIDASDQMAPSRTITITFRVRVR